ncbi:hypothetical protein [Pseudoalteromonas phenolica]|uniref:hypothetical protein n=1 Tax=Pseudoalteromonas phenolica TaxID=161398 RepID=UPI00384D0ED1
MKWHVVSAEKDNPRVGPRIEIDSKAPKFSKGNITLTPKTDDNSRTSPYIILWHIVKNVRLTIITVNVVGAACSANKSREIFSQLNLIFMNSSIHCSQVDDNNASLKTARYPDTAPSIKNGEMLSNIRFNVTSFILLHYFAKNLNSYTDCYEQKQEIWAC